MYSQSQPHCSRQPDTKIMTILNLNPILLVEKASKLFAQEPNSDSYRKILIPKDLNKPKFQQKGLIFVWPQKRTFYYNKELLWASWIMAHTLYWLHVIDILPSGAALPFEQPPWKYEAPLHKPKSRDFIIEPDWDSF